MDTSHRRTLIVSALLAALGPLVGNGLYAGPDGRGQELLDHLTDGQPAVAYVAYSLELLGFAATAVLVGCLVVRMAAAAPVAAVTGAVLGATMLAVKIGSLAPVMVATSSADELDPLTATMLLDVNGAAFVVSGLLLSLSLLALGLGLRHTDTPRWLVWWVVVVSALGVVAGLVGAVDPDRYVPIPFLLELLWMIALGVNTALDGRTTRADEALFHSGASV
jgi:hypothetical protein